MLKRCGRCRAEKVTSEFRPAKGRKDGLYGYCRPCQDADLKKYYEANRERVCKKVREYSGQPHVQERLRERSKREYRENRETHLANAKQWARDNRNRRREYVRDWNAENRERVRAYQKNYKARKRSSGPAAVTAAAWRLICAAFRNRCVYCGAECKLEQDHVRPLSRDGQHLPDNLVPACRHCNATKLNNAPMPFWWTRDCA